MNDSINYQMSELKLKSFWMKKMKIHKILETDLMNRLYFTHMKLKHAPIVEVKTELGNKGSQFIFVLPFT